MGVSPMQKCSDTGETPVLHYGNGVDMPPTALIDALHSVRRRVKLLTVAYGLGVVLVAAVALLLGTILLDFVLNLPAGPRVVLIVVASAFLGFIVARWVIKPLLARLSLRDVAQRLEQSFPEFDDRLRSTIDFSRSDLPGSEVMKQRVVTEATQMAAKLDLGGAVVSTPVAWSTAAGLGAILLLMLLSMVVSDQYVKVAFSRLFTPFEGDPWPKSVEIEMVGEVPLRVAVGHRVDLRMRLARGDKSSMRPIVYYKYDNGAVQQEYMTRGEDGVYTASLDARLDPSKQTGLLSVSMRAGDDRKELRQITVVPRLQITRAEAVIIPPKYVGAAAKATTVNLADGPAFAAAGSEVRLNVWFNKPLVNGSAILIEPLSEEMKAPLISWTSSDDFASMGTFAASQSLRFHIRGTDTDGFQNTAIEEYELIVRPDQNPVVQIEIPRRNEERTAVAVVPLQAVAEDDYGISQLHLMIERLDDRKKWEIPLVMNSSPVSAQISWARIEGEGDRQRHRTNYGWDLGNLENASLQPGDVLEYHLLVRDNYNLNGAVHEPAVSGKLRLTIISQEDLANRITDELRAISGQINEIRNIQMRTRQETENLAADTGDKDQLDAADRAAIERIANQQSGAASQTKQVAGKLDDVVRRLNENKSPARELKDISTEVNAQLNQTAENPMKDAAAGISSLKEAAADPKTRSESFSKAIGEQQKAADDLQRALDRMGNIGSLQQSAQKIADILSKQRELGKRTAEVGRSNLGKRPEQMSAEDREKLEAVAREQDDLAKQTEKALDDMEKIAEQMEKSDPASADAMKQAAETGQQQQVSSSQSKAADQARQNQQSQAQSAQKQAEIGLEMILNQLKQAEKRKLEELARKLEDMQKQIENLIRRQAGHNLDNLTIQGPDAMARLDAKALDALLTQSERLKDQPGNAPQLRQLTTAQEQTERNTRDLARTAEQMDNGTEAAAHLTRAAGKMERAIVSLRESKLPDAFDPQTEALAELEQAKKVIDEQKDAVDKEQEKQEKEAIRQAFIKIREDQEKLNQDTTRIDKAPRLADGNLKRDDAIRLGQLPGEQGKLADRAARLDEDLVSVGSIVYVWANKDIVDSMTQVKDDLGKPATGVATQSEQSRIVEQLDAMIRNLAVKPLEKEFEQRAGGGGGGGGGGSARLPTEVELRLLKELQQAVNNSTTKIDAQPDKDNQKLLALGNRQGELRSLLDQLLRNSSEGKLQLGPEPDNKEQLPEEADVEDIENQEFDQDLLNDQAAIDDKVARDMDLIGDRMARSRQRLALNNDPGKVTQTIQDRIVKNLDDLIELAREQQAQASSSSKPKPGQGQPKPQPNPDNAQANNQGNQPQPNTGQNPAQDSTIRPGGSTDAATSGDIQEKMAEWGGITDRQRQAVIDGAGETIIEKYRNFVDDYYRSLAEKSR
jgi:hypothetical protein